MFLKSHKLKNFFKPRRFGGKGVSLCLNKTKQKKIFEMSKDSWFLGVHL